ncbi:hypothetical protein ABWH91_02050 [Phycisphaerales bacterium ac7]
MTSPTKSSCLQAYRLLLYRRALHPELFPIKDRRTVTHMDYEFEGWIMPGAHLMRFVHQGVCATELITAADQNFPNRGLVTELPCAGERDHEEDFGDNVKYVSTVQTEQLPEALYRDTYDELTEFGARTKRCCSSGRRPTAVAARPSSMSSDSVGKSTPRAIT